MSGQERLSVIVPVYNGAATLAGCLDALYASRYPDFEVVVVDDGSKDATRQVAARYPCQILALPQNQGAAQAKNEGARVATGEILFFTDADVHVRPETLGWVAEDLRDPNVTGVVGLLADSCPHTNFASQFKNLWMHFTYRRQPRRVGLFFTSAAAIRRAIFVQESGFDAHYHGASITEDIEFGQRLLSCGYQIVMDKRLTVEHDKHYTTGEVLRTDLLRARGLTQTFIRNRLTPEKRAHYASVPWFFGAGVLCMGLATVSLILALVFGSADWLLGAAGLALVALVLNAPFLLALGRWRGPLFLLRSAGFTLVDLYASGLGIALGFYDFVRGRQY
jgi:glycosyltransferase involved in cell wall biosynthesis